VGVEVRRLDKTRLRLKQIPKVVFSQKIMEKIGLFLMMRIKERTLKGKDVGGKEFKSYSQVYKKIREKKGLPTQIVDLFFSGSMMGSMTQEASKDEVRLFFMNTKDREGGENPIKAFRLNESRPFFSISTEEVKEICKMYDQYLEKVI